MKYTPSALVSQFSGKQGSTVASHNRFGPYFKNRTIPVNPNTGAQQTARNNLAAMAQGWDSLTGAQRTAWNTAASTVTLVDRLGKTYKPSGFQYYMSVNRNCFVYSGTTTVVSAPPTSTIPAAIATLSSSPSALAFSLAYTVTPLAANTKIVVEATAPLRASIGFISKGLYRQIFISAAAAASPANILTAYIAKYGALISGKQVGIRVYVLTSDGQRSAPFEASFIVS